MTTGIAYQHEGATQGELIGGLPLVLGVTASPIVRSRPAYAARRIRKILHWSHFALAFDQLGLRFGR
jgi:hypothetical protein